jgi:hypothetical protein
MSLSSEVLFAFALAGRDYQLAPRKDFRCHPESPRLLRGEGPAVLCSRVPKRRRHARVFPSPRVPIRQGTVSTVPQGLAHQQGFSR